MLYFLKGRIAKKEKDSIIISVHEVGYQVYMSHLEDINTGDELVIYIYEIIKEDDHSLVGFLSLEEKRMFLSLVKVNGIGPKTALNILNGTTPQVLTRAISSGNVSFLKRLPNVGYKNASQIILDLKGEFATTSTCDSSIYDDCFEVLKTMGFKRKEIEETLSQINDPNGTRESVLKTALAMLNEMKRR